ncbi:MAG: DoxX family protein [Saprospiraceae bacterium]|nr:DoxX family protein [Saprospiraceae bacterium]
MNDHQNIKNQYRKYADLPIRLLVGFHLIRGTIDNILSWERMLEFKAFLELHGLIFLLLGACVSVNAQFICGILFIIGYKVRWAATVIVFNFIIAILLVHLGDTYINTFPALVMLAGSICLFFYGDGEISSSMAINKRASKTY